LESDLKELKDSTDRLTLMLQEKVLLLESRMNSLHSSQQSAAIAQNDVSPTLKQMQADLKTLRDSAVRLHSDVRALTIVFTGGGSIP
jgi:hypothetical protein